MAHNPEAGTANGPVPGQEQGGETVRHAMTGGGCVPRLAIVDENTLAATGLKLLLEPIAVGAEVCIYNSFDRLVAAEHPFTVHYFISSRIFFEHRDYFVSLAHKVIVMVCGPSPCFSDTSFRMLDVSAGEHELVRNLLRIHGQGHHPSRTGQPQQTRPQLLSPREKEILRMAVMGFVNKEIADRYNISLTTVISHRRNICEKLGFKSLSALTVYAVVNDIVKIEEI